MKLTKRLLSLILCLSVLFSFGITQTALADPATAKYVISSSAPTVTSIKLDGVTNVSVPILNLSVKLQNMNYNASTISIGYDNTKVKYLEKVGTTYTTAVDYTAAAAGTRNAQVIKGLTIANVMKKSTVDTGDETMNWGTDQASIDAGSDAKSVAILSQSGDSPVTYQATDGQFQHLANVTGNKGFLQFTTIASGSYGYIWRTAVADAKTEFSAGAAMNVALPAAGLELFKLRFRVLPGQTVDSSTFFISTYNSANATGVNLKTLATPTSLSATATTTTSATVADFSGVTTYTAPSVATPTTAPTPTLAPAKLTFDVAPNGSPYDYVMTFTMNTDFSGVKGLFLAYPNTKIKAVSADGTALTDTTLITVYANEALFTKKFWFNTAYFSEVFCGVTMKYNNLGTTGYDGIKLTALKNPGDYTNTTAPFDLYKIYFKKVAGVTTYTSIASDFRFCIPSTGYTPDANEIKGASGFPTSTIATGFSYLVGNGTSNATVNADNNTDVSFVDNTIPSPIVTIYGPDKIITPPTWAPPARFHVGAIATIDGKPIAMGTAGADQDTINPYVFRVALTQPIPGVTLLDGKWLVVEGTASGTIELTASVKGAVVKKTIDITGQASSISTGLTVQPPFTYMIGKISNSTDAVQGPAGSDLVINLNTPGSVNTFYKVFEGSPTNVLAVGKGDKATISGLSVGKHMITVWTAADSLATKNMPAYGRAIWVYITPATPLPVTSVKLTYEPANKTVTAQAYNNATALDNTKMLYKYFYKAKSEPSSAWVMISDYELNATSKVVAPPITLDGSTEYIVSAYAKATYSLTGLDKLGMIVIK